MTVKIIKNFVNKDLCQKIYTKSKDQVDENFGVASGYRESFEQLPATKDIDENKIWSDLKTYGLKETKENVFVFKAVSNILYEIKNEIEKFYGVKIEEVQSSLTKMLKGAKNELHSDMYLLNGDEWFGGAGKRSELKYSALLYLSSSGVDFEGGEITFPEYGISIRPNSGDLVFFTGDLDHKHYVSKVVSGERLTLVVFLRPENIDI
jgi:hypothetical protein